METASQGDQQVDYQERFFNARDGIRLFYRRWQVASGKGTVGVVHGFAEHCGRYDDMAARLTDAGWSVAAMDYRGHGQSGGRRAHIDRFEEYLQDLESFLDEIEADGLGARPVLLGHSQGGLIVARFAERSAARTSALVLSSPFLGLAMKVPAPKVWLGRLVSRWLPTFSMPTGLDPAWLSHDPAVVAAYGSDPMISHRTSARWFTEVTRAQDEALRDAPEVRLPLLVLQAGEDRLSSIDATERFVEAVGSEDKQFELYQGLYHEIFNELERDRVYEDLIAWLEKRAG